MTQFRGFPVKTQFTPVPNAFFSNLLPQISDIAELKVTLYILGMLYRQRGYPRFVAYSQLVASKSLMSSLKGMEVSPELSLRNALEMATRRGTLLHLTRDKDGAAEDIYFLNDEPGRQAVAKIQNGKLELPGLKGKTPTYIDVEEPPNVFTLYEQNIGMLTPMIAEELREAERLYPETWIKDAIKEAVNQNIRKKSYILAVLERWSAEGKDSGAYKRDSAKKTDPDKYIRGRYGHMVQR